MFWGHGLYLQASRELAANFIYKKLRNIIFFVFFRILSLVPYDSDVPQKVIFLQHGLKCSSADWTIQGLAYQLADDGHDVWLGNFRCNSYGLRHTNRAFEQSDEFWQFSWEEHGRQDLPATIGYVKQFTGRQAPHNNQFKSELVN